MKGVLSIMLEKSLKEVSELMNLNKEDYERLVVESLKLADIINNDIIIEFENGSVIKSIGNAEDCVRSKVHYFSLKDSNDYE